MIHNISITFSSVTTKHDLQHWYHYYFIFISDISWTDHRPLPNIAFQRSKIIFFRICSYFEHLINFLMIWLQMWTSLLVFVLLFFTVPLVANIFSFLCLYFNLVDFFLILSLFLLVIFLSVDHFSLWALFFILSCDLLLFPIFIKFSVSLGQTGCFTRVVFFAF